MSERFIRWCTSAAGITILLTILMAAAATLDRGPYILVNTAITGGMLALVAIGLALLLGVMNVASFVHGEYFMIGTLVAYYVFTPLQNLSQCKPQPDPGPGRPPHRHPGGRARPAPRPGP